jgi:hypothetical protein
MAGFCYRLVAPLIRAELSMTALRRTQLARLGVWIGLATLAIIVVIFAARTETGIRRIATTLTPSEAARTSRAPQLANRPPEQEAEQRRLAEAVRALSADRDRLAARLAVLERNLDEVTGSIPPAAANPKQPQVPVVASPLPPPATPSAQATQTAPNSQSRVAAGHLATGTSAADSVATKTEFGVDVGGNASIEGFRSLWGALKSSQPEREHCGTAMRRACRREPALPAHCVRRATAGASVALCASSFPKTGSHFSA